MHKASLFLTIMFTCTVLSCGDENLLEDYIIERPRVLAIKVTAPEVRPGEQVSLGLLVGGEDIDQDMDTSVSWFLRNEQQGLVGTAGYNQDLIAHTPADALDAGSQWVDLPVLARIEIGSKTLYGEKFARIIGAPTGKNPIIAGVNVAYLQAAPVSEQALMGDQIAISSQVRNVGLTASMEALAAGENDRPVFRWFVSTSKNSGGKLYVNSDRDDIKAVLGPGVGAAETKASVVFSLNGKDSDGSVQTGLYDVYLVVRDNASAPKSAADDRFGLDFFYFTLCVGDDCQANAHP